MSDYPTTNWFHKVDGTLGLVVHRHRLDPPDSQLDRDLREIIGEARRFAELVVEVRTADIDAVTKRFYIGPVEPGRYYVVRIEGETK